MRSCCFSPARSIRVTRVCTATTSWTGCAAVQRRFGVRPRDLASARGGGLVADALGSCTRHGWCAVRGGGARADLAFRARGCARGRCSARGSYASVCRAGSPSRRRSPSPRRARSSATRRPDRRTCPASRCCCSDCGRSQAMTVRTIAGRSPSPRWASRSRCCSGSRSCCGAGQRAVGDHSAR